MKWLNMIGYLGISMSIIGFKNHMNQIWVYREEKKLKESVNIEELAKLDIIEDWKKLTFIEQSFFLPDLTEKEENKLLNKILNEISTKDKN